MHNSIYGDLSLCTAEGELMLWNAWMKRIIDDFLYADDLEIYSNAKAAIFGKDMLFTIVCEWLDIDLSTVRRKLIKLKREHNTQLGKRKERVTKKAGQSNVSFNNTLCIANKIY